MDYISIYDIYGVEPRADSVKDHPDFPNPRQSLGELQSLAEGIIRSGGRDSPIVVWKRNGERVLLDGKRTVTAMLRNQLLRELLGDKLPVLYWQPRSNDGLSPDQEALAYMIRANSSQTKTGHKLLNFREEMAAVQRIKATGLSNEEIGKTLDYSRETVRKLLAAAEHLDERVKNAVGDSVTEETPLSRHQAETLAAKPKDVQLTALEKAKAAARAAVSKPNNRSAQLAVGKAIKEGEKKGTESSATAAVSPKQADTPTTPLEIVETLISSLTRCLDGQNVGEIIGHARQAQRWALILKRALQTAPPAARKGKDGGRK